MLDDDMIKYDDSLTGTYCEERWGYHLLSDDFFAVFGPPHQPGREERFGYVEYFQGASILVHEYVTRQKGPKNIFTIIDLEKEAYSLQIGYLKYLLTTKTLATYQRLEIENWIELVEPNASEY